MEENKYIRICPKCKSIDIDTVDRFTTGFLPNKYMCNNCKYTGLIFPEIELDKINKIIKANKK